MEPRSGAIAIGLLVFGLAATSCSSSGNHAAEQPARTTTAAPPTDVAAYATPGPYPVGYTTLRMNDRDVDVWYPADADAAAGKPKASYSQTDSLPDNVKSSVLPGRNTVVAMNAYKDVGGSAKGPFPVVLFSHGLNANRMASSGLTAGIASWGFVVVSVDYLERGTVTTVPGQKPATVDPRRDKRLMLASLDLIVAENARSGSLLHGIVDGARVGTVGHSAGGTTALDMLNDPRVSVGIGWAPGPSSGPPANKPTLIIGAANDSGFTPTVMATRYKSLPAPKRWVEIGNAGHNSFTDLCVLMRNGGGMVGYAIQTHLFSAAFAQGLLNGCEKTALTPERFFPVVQHFTVAELRSALGVDAQPVGLGAGIARAFPGIAVTYQQQP